MTRDLQRRGGVLVGVLVALLTALVPPADAASKKACKASLCQQQIVECKDACAPLAKRKRARCRSRCKSKVTKACRNDVQTCGDTLPGGGGGDGGGGGGQCAAYTSTCAAASLRDATLDTPQICSLSIPSLPACTASFESRLDLRTPMKTTAGECCVIDTCAGRTAFGVYNLLGRTGLPNPPYTAPVLVSLDYQSTYFERPPANQFDPGQWQFTIGAGGTVGCSVDVPNVLAGAGFRYNYSSGQLAGPYATRPNPIPQANWAAPWVLAGGDTAVSISDTAADPNDIVRPGGGTPHMWDLESLLFTTLRNPPVEVLSERFSVDKVCRDEIIVSAAGTFRRQDGSECSVTINARASTHCDTTDQCLGGDQCIDGRCRSGLPGFDPIGR